MADKSAAKSNKVPSALRTFLDEGALVRDGERALSPGQKFILFWVMVAKSFVANRCPVRASALAYTTLLALVPMLAVGIGISSQLLKKEGDKPGQQIINTLVNELAPQLGLIPTEDGNADEDARAEVVERITDFIANIHSGTLGVTGTIAIIFIAFILTGLYVRRANGEFDRLSREVKAELERELSKEAK